MNLHSDIEKARAREETRLPLITDAGAKSWQAALTTAGGKTMFLTRDSVLTGVNRLYLGISDIHLSGFCEALATASPLNMSIRVENRPNKPPLISELGTGNSKIDKFASALKSAAYINVN